MIKIISVGALTAAFVLIGLSLGNSASAAESIKHKTPHIGKVSSVTSNSVVFPIQFSFLRDKDVVARVKVTNRETGAVEYRNIAFELNSRGGKTLFIENLSPNTDYKFNVKIRRETSKQYSEQSNGRKATTR